MGVGDRIQSNWKGKGMNAIDKVRDEMAKDKSGQISYLGEGLTALLGIHPEYAEAIAAEGKTGSARSTP